MDSTHRATEELAADMVGERLERLVTENPAATERLMHDVLDTELRPAALYGTPEPARLGGDGDFVEWHYDNARALLDAANPDGDNLEHAAVLISAAQVHATLALVVSSREQTVALWRAR